MNNRNNNPPTDHFSFPRDDRRPPTASASTSRSINPPLHPIAPYAAQHSSASYDPQYRSINRGATGDRIPPVDNYSQYNELHQPNYRFQQEQQLQQSFTLTADQNKLKALLERLDCGQYFRAFLNEGFDRLESLTDMQEDDFMALNVRRGDRRLIQREVATLAGFPVNSPLHLFLTTNSSKRRKSDSEDSGSVLNETPAALPIESQLVRPNTGNRPNTGSSRPSTGNDSKRQRSNSTASSADLSAFGVTEATNSQSNTVRDAVDSSGSGKRKYRRHPKPDANAPEKPTSAYVQFSNIARESLKGKTFAESAKLVGEKWQNLDRHVKLGLEAAATREKHRYSDLLLLYKQSKDYQEYQVYLADFREKNTVTSIPTPSSGTQSTPAPLSRPSSPSDIPSTAGLSTGGQTQNHINALSSTEIPLSSLSRVLSHQPPQDYTSSNESLDMPLKDEEDEGEQDNEGEGIEHEAAAPNEGEAEISGEMESQPLQPGRRVGQTSAQAQQAQRIGARRASQIHSLQQVPAASAISDVRTAVADESEIL